MIRLLFICLLPFLSGSCTHQEFNQEIIDRVMQNGRQANEGFVRSRHFVEGWLAKVDPASGLIPTNLTSKTDLWEPHNSAADNYPFMVLTSYILDRDLYEGPMSEMLLTEKRLTSRLRSLPDIYSFSKKDFLSDDVSMSQIIFGTSEYIKDGLIPLMEYIGDSPWHERLAGMLNDLETYVDPRGMEHLFTDRPASIEEVHGELLQTLTRMYWKSSDDQYLMWAEKIGDFYLLGERDLAALEYLRMRDHGCEIIGGLSELYVTLHYVHPDKKEKYKIGFYRILDRILESGRNEDGLFYNAFNPVTGEILDSQVVDNWGYVFNAYYAVWMVDGKSEYREAVLKGFTRLNEKYRNFAWEGNSHDGYADALESGVNLYNREPVPELKSWIDSEIRVMFAMQQEDGIIGGWHGDGNFARTALMYSLCKTEGATIQPWREDLILGAEKNKGETYFVLSAVSPWEGNLVFDAARHRTILHLPIDYPRINQFPEWFTVQADKTYSLLSNKDKLSGPYTGKQLLSGLPLQLNEHEVLIITIKE